MYSLRSGVFSIQIELPPGKYQYKYVINNGEFWSCESSQTIIDDEHGNQNNIIEVKSNFKISEEHSNAIENNLRYLR